MPLIVKDRVRENSVTSGTGMLTLTGSPQAFQTFSSAIGNGNTTYYSITETGTGNFEVGLGTVGAGTLTRDTVLESSNAGSLVNFGSAAKDVFCTYPAEKAILGNTSVVASTGTGSVVLSDSPTITGNVNIGVSQYGNVGISTLDTGGVQNNNFGTSIEVINNIGAQSNDDFLGSETIFRGKISFQSSAYASWDNCTIQMPLTVVGSLTASGALTATNSLQLTGLSTANQNIATNQTSGSLTIGGTGATGAITLGRSTGTQTVGIATGVVGSGATKTVNIGTGSASVGSTVVNIGQPTGGTNNGNLTVAIGRQTRSAGTTTIGIGNGSVSGTGVTNISIGNTTGTTIMSGNVIFDSLQLPAFVGQNTQIVDDLLTSTVGTRAFVTDASTPVFGMPVSGGGSTKVPVYYDGTTWRVG